MAENKIRQRHEIPVEDTWATEDLYASDAAWEEELATLDADKDVLAAFAGQLAQSPENLCAYLEKMEQVNAKAELLANYCMRKSDEDTRNATYQAMKFDLDETVKRFGGIVSSWDESHKRACAHGDDEKRLIEEIKLARAMELLRRAKETEAIS